MADNGLFLVTEKRKGLAELVKNETLRTWTEQGCDWLLGAYPSAPPARGNTGMLLVDAKAGDRLELACLAAKIAV